MRDEDGSQLGMINQPQDGIPTVTMARSLELRSQAPVTKESPRPAESAFEALIGKHAPEFRKGPVAQQQTSHLGSRCAAKSSSLSSGRVELRRAVRTCAARTSARCPRSERPNRHRYPHARQPARIDHQSDQSIASRLSHVRRRPSREGRKSLGSFFSDFAVQAIPHAVAVDGNGIVVASGRLNEVHAKASGLVGKSPAPVKGDQ